MKVHQLALVKWLIRAIIGTLSADGDTTGGSSSTEVATDNPAEEPDHPPYDELKSRCAAAWAKFPVKVGTVHALLRPRRGNTFTLAKTCLLWRRATSSNLTLDT